ncbi:MAG: DUF2079 domain-containing protein [Solirubrobacteraceae bacterium]
MTVRSAARAVAAPVRAEPALALVVIATAILYSAYAVIRHDHFGSGFDLGIFTQAIWHYSHFEAPASSIRGFANLLGDHLHPVLVLLAPLMWIWSDPRTLLVAQAALVAASIVPVFLFARPRLGRPAALLLAVAYASFWGLGAGTGYEFHEVAFAPLLIAMAILFIDRRRWTAYFVTIGLLLCVKEDLSVLVCFFGLYLLTLRELRRGLITLALGIAWYELATRLVIPHFAAGVPFSYWTYHELGSNLGDAVLNVLRAPWKPFEIAFDHGEKVRTMLYLLLPFLGLTLCSRIALLAVPLLAERFLSSNTQFWGAQFHYSLAIAPVLAMGAAAGLGNLVRLAGPRIDAHRLATVGAAAMVVSGLLVAGVVIPIPVAPLRLMVKPSFYRTPAYAAAVGRALDHIPASAAVVAPDFLIAHLATRQAAYELDPKVGNPPGAYLVTGLVAPVGNLGEHVDYRGYQQDVARRLPLYEPTFYEDGWIVLRMRPGGAATGGTGVLTPLDRAPAGRLLAEYPPWQAAFAGAESRLLGCAATRQADVAACARLTTAAFLAEQARLDRTLRAALPAAVGGCRQLGDLARQGAEQLAVDVRRIGAKPALYAFAADVNDRDLPGRFTRFLLLCDPR